MSGDTLENSYDLLNLRKQLHLSQKQLADGIGLSLHAYQDLESGMAPLRSSHIMSCELLSLRMAVSARNINLAVPRIQADALDFAALMRGD